MRYILITGARDYPDIDKAFYIVKENLCQCGTIVVHGNARGIDREVGALIQEHMNYDSQMAINGSRVQRWPAQWTRFGRGAGPIRNREMIDWIMQQAERPFDDIFCFAFPLEPRQKNSGTWDCIDAIQAAHLDLQIYPAKLAVAGKD